MDWQKHPRNVKTLATEINNVIDGYWGREITEQQLKEIILYWASHENRLLFHENDFRPAIKQRIGLRRQEVLNSILEGYQFKIEGSNRK